MKNYFVLLLCFGVTFKAFSQNQSDLKGNSAYKKYDNSFITPNLRGKHSVSLDGLIGVYGSQTGAFIGADDSPNGNVVNEFRPRANQNFQELHWQM